MKTKGYIPKPKSLTNISDNKKEEKDSMNFIASFKCKTCNAILEKGLCGEHRNKTGHEDFEEIKNANN